MQALAEKSVCFIGDQPHPGNLALTQYCLSKVLLSSQARILDAGCGEGQTVHYLQNLGYRAYGFDANIFKRRRANCQPACIAADWFHIPTLCGYFEVVLAECTFSLIKRLKDHLAEIRRVLQPAGTLIFHGLYSRREDPELWTGKLGDNCSLKNIRNQNQIIMELENSGFQVIFLEDHSQVLQNNGSMNDWCWKPGLFENNEIQASVKQKEEMDIFDYFLTISKIKLGYYVAIAKKD